MSWSQWSRLWSSPAGDALVASAPPVAVSAVFRRFWPYAQPYRRWLWLTLVFVVLAPAIDTATLWLFKLLVDDVLAPRNLSALPPIALAYVGLTIVGGVVSFLDSTLSSWVGERFLLDMRTAVFRHLQSLSLDFFERRRLGDLLSRLTGDVSAIENLVLSGVADALGHVLRLVFFAGALLYLRWDLALVAFVVAPVFWVAARVFAHRIKQAVREKRRRSGSLSAVAEESLANSALVQAYNRQDFEVRRFEREGLGAFAAEMAATRLKALFSPLIDLLELAGVLVVVAVGTWELAEGRLSMGGLLAFMVYLSRLYGPVRGLSKLVNGAYAASASAERIVELLDQVPSVPEKKDAIRIQRATGHLVLDGVSFGYPGAPRLSLVDVSLELAPGELVALVGPSGAGKSTVLKLLLRFYDPVAGRVLLDGQDLGDLELRSLRNQIAIVQQETLLFDGTVRENIAFGRPDATEREIEAAARAADAHTFVRALPDGYDTLVGQKGRRLSGGQRQRIAIARAMLRNAPILLLDEPTTALDAAAARRVLAPLRRLMHGRATLLVSHNLMAVRDASRIVVLDEGRVIAQGTHAELLESNELYRGLYRLHAVEGSEPADGVERGPAPRLVEARARA